VLALALYGLATTGRSQQSPPHNREQPTKAESHERQAPGYFAPPIAPQRGEERKQESHWYSQLFEKPTDWLLAIFTGLLVVYTRRLYVATRGMREATDKLWTTGEAQRSDMQKSIAAAEKGAEAAFKSARVAELSLMATQRARVVSAGLRPGHGNALDIPGQPLGLIIQAEWKNVGPTPALNARLFIDKKIFAPELENQVTFEIATPIVQGSQATIGQGLSVYSDTQFIVITTLSKSGNDERDF